MTMCHVHGHSSFSTLDGVGSPSHRAAVAARHGQAGLAITDHAHMNGVLAHRKACEREGIIPIAGSELYWRPNRLVRDKEWQRRRWHFILLARNLAGWHNLIRLTSEAHASGFYMYPCIDVELQKQYSEGLIATTACVLGPLAFLIENGTDQQVSDWIKQQQAIYGENLFFSIMPHDMDRQRRINLEIVSLANRYGAPIIHEKDSHYPERGWVDTQKVAILVGMNKTFAQAEEENRKRIEAGDEVYELWHDNLHISTEEEDREMYARFHPDLPVEVIDEAIRNTEVLLSRIDPLLPDRSLKMPRTQGIDPRKVVLDWCYEGLTRIGKRHDQVYEQRLEYEASVIDARNAWSYFALVGDVVRWARSKSPLPSSPDDPHPEPKKPIRLNTRGSAAASLICYTSGISTLDPITHKFKFERFLNPERVSLPDIDLDVASSGRRLIKSYVVRKFGKESVADVVAQQHFQPRAALKNVTHTIYGYGSAAFDEISVLCHEDTGVIDQVNDIDLEKIKEREPQLASWAAKYPDAWLHAVRLENAGDPSVLRISKHAAAVVILPGKVSDFMPTIRAEESEETARTAWAETSKVSIVDEIGAVKVDFLGLKGMDQQQMIVDAIAESTGEVIDLDQLPPLKDPYDVEDEVMDIFRKGLTLGVNQFEGQGVTTFMKSVSPDNVVDLTAVNALYRPGPIGSGGHNRFAKRKGGSEGYELHPVLRPILSDTYGCLTFQEQVMELFQVLVGYSAGQADDVRKEIDKLNRAKNQDGRAKLAMRHDAFIASTSEKLGSRELAEQLWQEILPYTGYAFNRPHAGSYSTQAYQDGWLKAHYPLFSYAVIMTLDEKKTAAALRESRAFGVSVLPPDINTSKGGFSADYEANAIRYGLAGIKGIGQAVVDQIIADRPFKSFDDFEMRSSRKYSKVNKGAREKLLLAGALDCFGCRRDGVLAWNDEKSEKDVFWDATLRAKMELQYLGVALEPGGALGEDAEIVRQNIFTEEEIAKLSPGDEVIVGGEVEARKTTVKRGRQAGREMATLTVTLDFDRWRATMFPEVWDRCRDLVESGEMLMLAGKKDDRGAVIVRECMPLNEFVSDIRAQEMKMAA